MQHESSGPILSTVFVDYDNIYLSLKRKSDEAAKRFAKDSGLWLQGLQNGSLITPTSSLGAGGERRIVMARCYGNPVPRRNAADNSTDMNSFPFVRHHFLKSGFEVIDCPPLTAQLKNSADIRIVMDIRDLLTHETKFGEFIILSGDADFTPVLHRLRAHARRTVVFANDHTAQPYTAISDGEIRESSLIALLLNGRLESDTARKELAAPQQSAQPIIDVPAARQAILSEVIAFVRSAPQAVPLETLADRAVRLIGHEKTVGTSWGGFGSFRDLLLAGLPDDLHLSDTAPYTVFDANRHISQAGLIAPQAQTAVTQERIEAPRLKEQPQPSFDTMGFPGRAFQPAPAPRLSQNLSQPATSHQAAPVQQPAAPAPRQQAERAPLAPLTNETIVQRHVPLNHVPAAPPAPPVHQQHMQAPPAAPQVPDVRREPQRAAATPPPAAHQPAPQQRTADQATQIQQSIARIHEACQAPALAPAEYRVLFDVMAQEISASGLQGAQTLINITQRAREFGLDIKRDDLRFILEVVSESDPWFEQGASANLFAGRFRNFVVARCRSQGLNLSADEIDLVEAWFSAQAPQQASRAPAYGRPAQQAAAQAPAQPAPQQQPAAQQPPPAERWWSLEEGRQHIAEQRSNYGQQGETDDEFPRIVRTRLRG
jgi:hypothetical protein